MFRAQAQHRRSLGFTLIEMIAVIVITGIVAAMVAVFIRQPVEAYVDTNRRAALSDAADTAARFMARELQAALPNSVRVSNDGSRLEFIPIRDAGRYRAEAGTSPADDPLSFSNAADTSFDVLGPPLSVLAGDSLVVYNLGIPGADAYESPPTNRRAATAGTNLAKITFTATNNPLPFPSPGSRFQIVATPVSYVCDAIGRRVLRYSGYGFQAAQPAAFTGTPGVIGTNVSACAFAYTPGPLQRYGLVSIRLALSQSGETVTLQQQVNVDNVP